MFKIFIKVCILLIEIFFKIKSCIEKLKCNVFMILKCCSVVLKIV